MDDVSFYKTADGYLAREKGGIDGETTRNSPRFQRTRENNAEFKEVTKAVDLFCATVGVVDQPTSEVKIFTY